MCQPPTPVNTTPWQRLRCQFEEETLFAILPSSIQNKGSSQKSHRAIELERRNSPRTVEYISSNRFLFSRVMMCHVPREHALRKGTMAAALSWPFVQGNSEEKVEVTLTWDSHSAPEINGHLPGVVETEKLFGEHDTSPVDCNAHLTQFYFHFAISSPRSQQGWAEAPQGRVLWSASRAALIQWNLISVRGHQDKCFRLLLFFCSKPVCEKGITSFGLLVELLGGYPRK